MIESTVCFACEILKFKTVYSASALKKKVQYHPATTQEMEKAQ